MTRLSSKITRLLVALALLFPGLSLSARCGMAHCSMGPGQRLRCVVSGIEGLRAAQASGHAALSPLCGGCGSLVLSQAAQAVGAPSTSLRPAAPAYSPLVADAVPSAPLEVPGSRFLSRAGPPSPGARQAQLAVPTQNAPPVLG